MIRLLCRGEYLDLYDNASVQFTHDNPLFAFDELKCERTTNFKIPATPKNDLVFSISKLPAYSGEGMRRKFDAQLQMGSIVRNGFLYISNFDGKDYNSIFVTGELVGLQQITQLGKISEIMTYDEYVRAYQDIYFADNPALNNLLFAHMHYHGENGIKIQPSINVGLLIDKICAHLGVQCTGKPQGLYQMRLAVAELVLPEGENGHLHSVYTGGDPMNTIYPAELQRVTISQEVLTATTVTEYHNGHNNPYGTLVDTYTSEQTAAHWKTLNNITIKFPEDLDEDYFLIMVNDLVPEDATFLGDYYFTKTVIGVDNIQTVVHGEPLAGRTLELTTGTNTIFLLVKKDDYVVTCKNTYIEVDDETVAVTAVRRGWDFTSALNYNIEVYIEPQQSDAGTGDIVRLQDNLPAITFTELLKGIASEYGLILSYNDDEGIKFETLDFSTYPVVELKNLVKRGEVQRTFGKYAQRNRVVYKEDGAFLTEEQTPIFYTIDNDNIERDKDLQIIPWTNGGFYSSVQGILVYDRVGRKDFMELRANPSWANSDSLRAYIVKNTNLQSLCDASTQFKIDAHMTALEYFNITPKTLLLIEGILYTWTNRQWQADKASFTLAKLP